MERFEEMNRVVLRLKYTKLDKVDKIGQNRMNI